MPYSEYCNRHVQAINAISLITNNGFNDAMLELIKEDSRCHGLDLQSFLLEPIQRIARYPLLIKQIIHYSEDEQRKKDLVKALQSSEQLLFKINEGIRESENRNKLASIKIKGLQVDLMGQTRFLGQRLLRHQGGMMKAKSKKRLHALLLTDMLLLLLLPPSMNAKEGDGNSYELYRDPILLDTLHVMECEPARVPLLGNPRLCMEMTTGMDKALVVALSSPQERTEWITELRSAVSDYHKKRVVMTRSLRRITRVVGTLAVQIIRVGGRRQALGHHPSKMFVLNLTLNTQSMQTPVIASDTRLMMKAQILSVASLDEVLSFQLYAWHQLQPAEYMADADMPLNVLEYYADIWTEEMVLDMMGMEVTIKLLYKSIH
jgi:guanine nucleotide exchange factor for Rho/Rac/Cdc42-like GTPase family protein/PH (Pleckstrin Homology) domain-containing protein